MGQSQFFELGEAVEIADAGYLVEGQPQLLQLRKLFEVLYFPDQVVLDLENGQVFKVL